MKVAIVAPEDLRIPPTRGGSVQIYLHALLQSLNGLQTNFPLSIILISPDKTKPSRVQATSVRASNHTHYTIRAKDKKDYQRQATLFLKRIKPDVIQVDNRPLFALELKDQMKVPVIANLHSTTFLGPLHMPSSRAAQVLKKMDCVVLNSRYLQRTIARRFGLQSSDWNPHVIYPGIDLAKYTFRRRSIRRFTKAMPLRLVFVGRVVRQKGVHVLIQATRLLHDSGYPVRLTIVGRTPPWERAYERSVKRIAQGYPIDFAGFISPQHLPPYYAANHLLVCPSQYDEAFGLVNLEAMACGLPVIGSAVGGIPEVIDAASGALVKRPQQPQAFYEAILDFLQHPERIAGMSEQARRRAEQFTWRRTARSFAHLYRQVFGRR